MLCPARFRCLFSQQTIVVACVVAALLSSIALADDVQTSTANLPLKKVVLFNAGVGFFERSGQVQDNAQVELQFNVDDINDLLQSMVVQDFDGGKVSAVGYASRDPITKTLKTFAIDLTTNPTLAQLLAQVRGEKVQLDAPDEITGVILGLQKRTKKIANHDEVIVVDVLNLLTDDGLRSVDLDNVGRVKLLNEKLDAELRKALALLATAHSTDKKAVTLDFLGEGVRRVRVGYIQDMPVWKTSYRLVLDEKDENTKPMLQGWAIVENTTEEDWNNVRLSLVSGRPINFVMDLYQPLYVPRPEVQYELFTSLTPQSYGQDLARKKMEFARRAAPGAPPAKPALPAATGRRQRGLAAELGEKVLESVEESAIPADATTWADLKDKWNFSQGVQSAAQAGDVGELFQYEIDTPVTLSRQKSAMLPIVNGEVKAAKVSIYNEGVLAKHPLSGLRLTNSTDLHLMQGPITVFDGGVYAGDAKIDDLPPGSERLLSYAIDLDTEVAPHGPQQTDDITQIRLIKGTMLVTRKAVRSKEYTVKNSGEKAKNVLVEYPLDKSWKLVTPEKPGEKTRDRYRFAVTAEPGVSAELKVVEEKTTSQYLALNNMPEGTIRMYLAQKVLDGKIKAALAEIIERKTALAEIDTKRAQFEQQINAIAQEQSRIRQNMSRLDRNSDLFKRYVKKFNDQENQIENFNEEIAGLLKEQNAMQKALDEYLTNLTID